MMIRRAPPPLLDSMVMEAAGTESMVMEALGTLVPGTPICILSSHCELLIATVADPLVKFEHRTHGDGGWVICWCLDCGIVVTGLQRRWGTASFLCGTCSGETGSKRNNFIVSIAIHTMSVL